MDAGSPIPMSSAPDILVLFTLYHFSGCADICFVFGWLRLLRGGAGSRPVRLSCLATAIASFALDEDMAPLREACAEAGIETQVLAWDLPCNAGLRKSVAAHANTTMLGTVALVERPRKRADVMLRYNFPAAGLSESALRTLVLLVLDTGAGVRRGLTG